jgi:hypothetical protein
LNGEEVQASGWKWLLISRKAVVALFKEIFPTKEEQTIGGDEHGRSLEEMMKMSRDLLFK